MPNLIRRLNDNRAQRHSVSLVVVLLVIASVPALRVGAATITLDFNGGTNGGIVGNSYAGLGVTFSANTQWDIFTSPDEAAVSAGGLKISDAAATGYKPKTDSPLVATFNPPLSSFSIRGLNVGANGARIEAYDAVVGGNLVEFDEEFGADLGESIHPLLSVNVGPSTAIHRVKIFQPLSLLDEGVLFDNMSFTPIPEPSTFAIALLSLLGVVGCRRNRN